MRFIKLHSVDCFHSTNKSQLNGLPILKWKWNATKAVRFHLLLLLFLLSSMYSTWAQKSNLCHGIYMALVPHAQTAVWHVLVFRKFDGSNPPVDIFLQHSIRLILGYSSNTACLMLALVIHSPHWKAFLIHDLALYFIVPFAVNSSNGYKPNPGSIDATV